MIIHEDDCYLINISEDKETMSIYHKCICPDGEKEILHKLGDLNFLDDMFDLIKHLINNKGD